MTHYVIFHFEGQEVDVISSEDENYDEITQLSAFIPVRGFDLPDGWEVGWVRGEITATAPGGQEYFPARGEDEIEAIQAYLALAAERE